MSIFAHSKFASSQIKIEPQTRRYNLIQCYRCFFINKEYFARQDFTLTGIDPEKTTFTINHKCLVRLFMESQTKLPLDIPFSFFQRPLPLIVNWTPLSPLFVKIWTGFYMFSMNRFLFSKISIFSRLFHL